MKYFIKSIVIIVVILLIVYAGQKPYFQQQGKVWLQKVASYITPHWQKVDNYVKNQVLPRVGGEVENKKQEITQEIIVQKDSFYKTIWQQVKNYFANEFSKFTGTKVEP